jgi:hypothetical protein
VQVQDVDLRNGVSQRPSRRPYCTTHVAGLELLEGILDGQVERFLVIPSLVSRCVLAQRVCLVTRSELGRNHLKKLFSTVFLRVSTYLPSGHGCLALPSIHRSIVQIPRPLSKPLAGMIYLTPAQLTVTVGSVDRVPSGLDERVKELKGLLLVHGAHHLVPCLSDGPAP